MMKRKWLPLVLILCLLWLPAARAEDEVQPATRQETITLEGMEEQILTTRFESPRGYVLWYDPNVIAPQPEEEGAGMDLFLMPGLGAESAWMVVMPGEGIGFEQTVQSEKEVFIDNYGEVTENPETGLFEGYTSTMLHTLNGDQTLALYIVDVGGEVFRISVCYPGEADEGLGSRIRMMLRSFEPLNGAMG